MGRASRPSGSHPIERYDPGPSVSADRAISQSATDAVSADAHSVSADASRVSADGGTVSADGGTVSADAGTVSADANEKLAALQQNALALAALNAVAGPGWLVIVCVKASDRQRH
jgi:hypothetical protein